MAALWVIVGSHNSGCSRVTSDMRSRGPPASPDGDRQPVARGAATAKARVEGSLTRWTKTCCVPSKPTLLAELTDRSATSSRFPAGSCNRSASLVSRAPRICWARRVGHSVTGDRDRARAFVDRAARLPYDEHEQAAPVAIAVHMELFCLVTDTLEQAEADDSRWLDAAVDTFWRSPTSRHAVTCATSSRPSIRTTAEHTRTLADPLSGRPDTGSRPTERP